MKQKSQLKKLILPILISILIITLAVFILNKKSSDENIIGGDRDEHGCLGPAGYSWNSTEQECVREWEISDDRYQITNFQSCIEAGYPVMESYPRQCRTLGGRLFVKEN